MQGGGEGKKGYLRKEEEEEEKEEVEDLAKRWAPYQHDLDVFQGGEGGGRFEKEKYTAMLRVLNII